MSSFEVKVRRITVSPHPNADRLEVGQVDGYQFVVPKGSFLTGDLFVYIPEQSILPESLILLMGLEGRLDGPEHNRVKAHKLRGVLSQGLALTLADFYRYTGLSYIALEDGKDVGWELGITKWEPPVPRQLQGKVKSFPRNAHPASCSLFGPYTDIENLKKFPYVFKEGELVWITEKLHGTCCIFGIADGEAFVSSLGVSKKGLVLEEDEQNTYWRAVRENGLYARLSNLICSLGFSSGVLYGEVIGVQDLMYGLTPGQLGFYAFDLFLPRPFWLGQTDRVSRPGFAPYRIAMPAFDEFGIKAAPVLYHGPYSRDVVEEYTTGPSTLGGNIREGVVIRPEDEDSYVGLGRRILKSISPDYLTRKNGSEYK